MTLCPVTNIAMFSATQALATKHTCLLRHLVSSILQTSGCPVSACLQTLAGLLCSRLQLLLIELPCLRHSIVSHLLGTGLQTLRNTLAKGHEHSQQQQALWPLIL